MTPLTTTTRIYDAIEGLVKEFAANHDLNRQEINEGWCDVFAERLEDMGFGEVLWGSEIPSGSWGPEITNGVWPMWEEYDSRTHCFIMHNGRYYDSESPDGVE